MPITIRDHTWTETSNKDLKTCSQKLKFAQNVHLFFCFVVVIFLNRNVHGVASEVVGPALYKSSKLHHHRLHQLTLLGQNLAMGQQTLA